MIGEYIGGAIPKRWWQERHPVKERMVVFALLLLAAPVSLGRAVPSGGMVNEDDIHVAILAQGLGDKHENAPLSIQ
jgi:hypothetical protein